jgi:predicted alpha/beta hydrolase family esterase
LSVSVLILPGIGGSGPAHWQSRWQREHRDYQRIEMPDWDRPALEVWLNALDAAVARAPARPVVVAHSLGCLALAHWAARGGRLHAALLVAVPDPNGPQFPEAARSFSQLPLQPLAFPSCLVASGNDPYGSRAFAIACAKAWGSELCDIGEVGHINAESELGDWAEGKRLLDVLLGRAGKAITLE